jgi:hypothetical protein
MTAALMENLITKSNRDKKETNDILTASLHLEDFALEYAKLHLKQNLSVNSVTKTRKSFGMSNQYYLLTD